MIFDSFWKSFTPAIFKSKYRNEVMKTLNIETPALKVLWETAVPVRFVKLRGKASIVEIDFSKVAVQKSGAVDKHGTFFESFLENFKKVFRIVYKKCKLI